MSAINCGVLSRYQYVLSRRACPIYVLSASIWRVIRSRVSGDASNALIAKRFRRRSAQISRAENGIDTWVKRCAITLPTTTSRSPRIELGAS